MACATNLRWHVHVIRCKNEYFFLHFVIFVFVTMISLIVCLHREYNQQDGVMQYLHRQDDEDDEEADRVSILSICGMPRVYREVPPREYDRTEVYVVQRAMEHGILPPSHDQVVYGEGVSCASDKGD